MPRYKITLEYDGTGLAGWQRQQDKLSVQELLETALERFSGKRVETVAAGRTDAGVHALAQVVHFDLHKEYPPYNVMHGINFHLLPHPIVALQAEQVDEEFHARFAATGRSYMYRIINRSARLGLDLGRAWHVHEKLDIDAMNEAAQYLLGKHDFTSFRDSECQAKSPEKTLDRLDIIRHGEEIRLIVEARSFLHHQVRIMTGSLKMVGEGKWRPADLKTALEAKNRSAAGPTAPSDGLYLTQVRYD